MESEGQPMKWHNNMIQVYKSGSVGKCPCCNSSDTDYMFYKHDSKRSFMQIWCNSCDEQIHVDGGAIPLNRKRMDFEDALKERENYLLTV